MPSVVQFHHTKDILLKGDLWIIQTNKDSGLRSCGGAGFPSGLKSLMYITVFVYNGIHAGVYESL